MSFLNLPTGLVLAGLALIAGVLFLLQRLRVRHRPVRVVTTLFWKEALEEARARVLVRKFRHPLAWLLLLLICSLLWLGFGRPHLEDASDRDHVLLVDGSAGMLSGSRFDDTIELLKERVGDLPRDRRTVLLCGSRSSTLLAPGENDILLEKRLEGVRPEACPASIENGLRQLIKGHVGGSSVSVYVVGDAPVPQELGDLLPAGMELRRLALETARPGGNRGITGLGVTEARSGAWDKVDVFVEIRGADATGATGMTASLDGRPIGLSGALEPMPDRERILLRDLPARGNTLALKLTPADAFPADDKAAIVLPRRPLLRVALSPSLEPRFRAVLEADPAIVSGPGEPDVVVRRAGEEFGGSVPALELVPDTGQEEAILLEHESSLSSRAVLLASFDSLGLDRIDAMELAQAAGRVIAVGATPAERRGIGIWESLFSERYNFVHSRSFPLFVAMAVRWLAEVRDFPAYAAAGEPVHVEVDTWKDAAGRPLSAAGSAFVPPRAGTYESRTGERLVASLLDPVTTVPARATALALPGEGEAENGYLDLVTGLVAFTLLLLFTEWILFRTGRIP